MSMNKNTMTRLKNMGVKRARMNANFKTGNLRYNAITGRLKGSTIELTWNGSIAHYWVDLEYGTKNMNAFKIVTSTVMDFRDDIVNELTSHKDKYKKRVNREYDRMKKYEDYLANSRYKNASDMFEAREKQKWRSMNRVKGKIL